MVKVYPITSDTLEVECISTLSEVAGEMCRLHDVWNDRCVLGHIPQILWAQGVEESSDTVRIVSTVQVA